MPDLADLYPGYQSHWIDTSAGKLFARTGGNGPPLLLLHGYAQTHVMWHRVAPALAGHFSLVIADLPGYGWSSVPESGEDHAPYDKRSMAKAMVELMEKLGHIRFRLAGHDRGGRVAYRLALDHPHRLEKLSTLDIVPTHAMWHGIDAKLAFRIWHWTFLALPAPFPENDDRPRPGRLLEPDHRAGHQGEIRRRVRSPRARALPRVLQRSAAHPCDLRGLSRRPHHRLHTTTRPTARPARRSSARCSRCGVRPESRPKPEPARSRRGANGRTDVRGAAIDCGHYLPEEHPDEVSKALIEFFK